MEKFEAQFNSEYEEDQKNGEILPIEILIKFIKNKWPNCKTIKEKKEFIDDFNFDEEISIEFLMYLVEKEYEKNEFKKLFNDLKFSISNIKKLKIIINYLPKDYIENELDFFLNTKSKEYFIEFYNILKKIS